jgi:lia operon protein LiaG
MWRPQKPEPQVSRNFIRASLFALTALVATSPLQAQAERVSVTGAKVGIWNIIGKVTVVPVSSGRAVNVSVTRRGRDASKLTIEKGPIAGRETVRIVYPGDRITDISTDRYTGWRTELRVRDDGTFGDGWEGEGRTGRGGRKVIVGDRGESGTEAAADLEIEVPSGQEIAIYLVAGEITARNLNGKILLDTHRAEVRATAMKGDLSIDTGSGDVVVDGMEGPLMVDVGSGDVTLSNVKGSELDVDTGSGEVTGTAIASDALNIDTGSGGIELDGLTAQRVAVDVGSGDVELTWTTDPGDVEIDSGSGSVTLTMPASSGATLEIESSSGDIESGFEIRTNRIERDSLRGTFGDGRGRITIDTGSGDVDLVKR